MYALFWNEKYCMSSWIIILKSCFCSGVRGWEGNLTKSKVYISILFTCKLLLFMLVTKYCNCVFSLASVPKFALKIIFCFDFFCSHELLNLLDSSDLILNCSLKLSCQETWLLDTASSKSSVLRYTWTRLIICRNLGLVWGLSGWAEWTFLPCSTLLWESVSTDRCIQCGWVLKLKEH